MTGPLPPDVAAVVVDWPAPAQAALRAIRQILLDTAAEDPAIGPLSEALKWGEPSWRPRSKSGTTLRVAWKPKRPQDIGLFVPCQTTLADTMRSLYPQGFHYEGNRAFWMPLGSPLPEHPLRHAARLGLTYHKR